MIFRIISVIALTILLSSCYKAVDLKISTPPSALVVYALFDQDHAFEVSVSHSYTTKELEQLSVLSKEEKITRQVVTNANVVIYKNNEPLETLVYDGQQHVYRSANNTKIDGTSKYSVKVSAQGYTDVSSPLVEMPDKVNIKSISIRKEVGIGNQTIHQVVDEVTIEFDDPGGKANYYWIKFKNRYDGQVDVIPMDKDVVVQYGDDVFNNNPTVSLDKVILSDRNFDGMTKRLVLRVPSYLLRDNDNNLAGEITFISTTEDVFKYLKAGILSVANPFAEPVQSYTNMQNGYGIFGLSSADTKEIR